jgi:hypothetical protein
MALHASWVHGTALAVENPENLARVGFFGWGGDMLIQPGKSSWFHLPVPTPVIVADTRLKLVRVFVLFKSDPGAGNIRNVHVWDGSAKVTEFNNLNLQGEHRNGLDAQNTFNLPSVHTVAFGIGISFFFQAAVGIDSPIPPARLIVGTGGGDFTT